MGFGREWWPYNETVGFDRPCGECGYEGEIHLGYAPTGGVRFAGMQVLKTGKSDIAVCGGCGRAESLGTQGRAEASQVGSWEITGRLGLGYVNVESGRTRKRPF